MNNIPYPGFDFSTTKDDLLIGVDMQEDFVNGALGSEDARAIVDGVAWFYGNFQGDRALTQDTHGDDYLETQEGRNLAVVHTKRGTPGWRIVAPVAAVIRPDDVIIEKPGFGSLKLIDLIRKKHYKNIYLCGLDTGYCVISNAVCAKTADPEAVIHILARLCACATKDTHETALKAMATLQMDVMY